MLQQSFRTEAGQTGSIWLMGLSAAGKTTLARLLIERLWREGFPCMLIDGDETREFLYGEKLGFDIEARRRQTQRIISLVNWVSKQGILPVIAIMHPVEEDRRWCREHLNSYYEVYLKCDIDTCVSRDPKDLYKKAKAGEITNIAGLDLPYDEPEHADLVLDSAHVDPEHLLEELWQGIEGRLHRQKDA